MMLGILMFCCRIPSRRRLGQLSQSKEFYENWCRLSGARTDAVAHPDTLMYLLKQIDNAELGAVAPKMIKDLIRAKRLPTALLEGHLRWKIENEGNNQQKNGYSMEHFCDCSDTNALLGLFLLLQIAHTLMQLVARSSIVEGFETLEFLAYLLLESLRNIRLPNYLFAPQLPPMQIRTAPP